MIGKPRAEVESGELKICGLAAVRARFQRDADSIRRLYFDYATGRKIGVMCKALAAARKIYRCVEPGELEKIAGSIHHGGVVAAVAHSGVAFVAPGDVTTWARRNEALLVLDRIGNAHNLGAIARTAAFLGLPRIVIPDDPAAAQPNDAAYRVAEGGLEFVEVRRCGKLAPFLRDLAAAGYDVLGAATQGGNRVESLKEAFVEERGSSSPRPKSPIAVVLGNEEHGLATDVAAACTRLVTIPGGGKVESLNVSVAPAILHWEMLNGRPGPRRG